VENPIRFDLAERLSNLPRIRETGEVKPRFVFQLLYSPLCRAPPEKKVQRVATLKQATA
jgi:hypothetical protein